MKKELLVFLRDEILSGEDFWEFIYDDKPSYKFILGKFRAEIKKHKEKQ